ncbi:unnamed protein product [Lampetra fluviatilis]
MCADLPEGAVDPHPVEEMEGGLTGAEEVGVGTDNHGEMIPSATLETCDSRPAVGHPGLRSWTSGPIVLFMQPAFRDPARSGGNHIIVAGVVMNVDDTTWSPSQRWRRLLAGLSSLHGVGESSRWR